MKSIIKVIMLKKRPLNRELLLLILSLVAFCLYLPPENACALTIPPDSTEYSIGLVNLFEHGIFGFTLNGVWYPSRYAPWFSLFCLTPAYLLSGGNPLCFHWAILVFALAVVLFVVKWGERMGLGRWSLVSVLLLLVFPDFVFYSRIVMTEIPYVAIFAVSGLVWIRFIERGRDLSLKFCLGVGALVAWGGMIRPTMLPMLVPFAMVIWMRFPLRERILRWMVLAVPSLIYEGGNLLYNKYVFGSISRSGYQYWVPVPCDFPDLMFNWGNVCRNVDELFDLPIVWITLAMLFVNLVFTLLVARRRFGDVAQHRFYLGLFVYLCFQFAILVALYGSYYWSDSRFYLTISICIIPLFLYVCRTFFSCLPVNVALTLFIVVVLLSGRAFLFARPSYRDQPFWRNVLLTKGQIASRVLPEHSVVIQLGDPNILENFGYRQRGLIHFPYGRFFDYEKFMIAPASIRKCCRPTYFHQLYISAIVEQGICQAPFPVTFSENPKHILKFLSEGKRVFVEQQVLNWKENDASFKEKLQKVGLVMKSFGGWSVPALTPNPIRHYYDSLVLGDCHMDSRPEVSAIYHEIVRLENVAQ